MLELLPLMLSCAPQVAPPTLAAIIRVESGGNPWAIHVNGVHPQPRPHTRAEALRAAQAALARGHSVDLGLMQINSRNLPRLGYTVVQMLDPCLNLQAGARILTRNYLDASRRWGPGQSALRAALSAYNTGNFEAGFRNGYVAKYGRPPKPAAPARQQSPGPNPYTSPTTVYVQP